MKLPSKKTVGLLLLGATIAFVLLPAAASLAATEPTKLIVPLPGIANANVTPTDYVQAIYRWSIGVAAFLAMGQFVLGGIQYILSAGNLASKETANEKMKGAASGLVILLSIVIILSAINPRLINIQTGTSRVVGTPQTNGPERPSRDAEAFASDLLGPEFKKAGLAAMARLDQNPDTETGCFVAAKEIVEEIKEYVRGVDDEIMEIIDDTPLKADYDDFREYFEKYAEIPASETYIKACAADALITALYSARVNLSETDFVRAVALMRNFPPSADASAFLTKDPLGRAALPADALRTAYREYLIKDAPEILVKAFNAIRTQITAHRPDKIIDGIKNFPESSTYLSTMVNTLLLEASEVLTPVEYNTVISALLEARYNVQYPGVRLILKTQK